MENEVVILNRNNKVGEKRLFPVSFKLLMIGLTFLFLVTLIVSIQSGQIISYQTVSLLAILWYYGLSATTGLFLRLSAMERLMIILLSTITLPSFYYPLGEDLSNPGYYIPGILFIVILIVIFIGIRPGQYIEKVKTQCQIAASNPMYWDETHRAFLLTSTLLMIILIVPGIMILIALSLINAPDTLSLGSAIAISIGLLLGIVLPVLSNIAYFQRATRDKNPVRLDFFIFLLSFICPLIVPLPIMVLSSNSSTITPLYITVFLLSYSLTALLIIMKKDRIWVQAIWSHNQ